LLVRDVGLLKGRVESVEESCLLDVGVQMEIWVEVVHNTLLDDGSNSWLDGLRVNVVENAVMVGSKEKLCLVRYHGLSRRIHLSSSLAIVTDLDYDSSVVKVQLGRFGDAIDHCSQSLGQRVFQLAHKDSIVDCV
jgi:hypothetical protein